MTETNEGRARTFGGHRSFVWIALAIALALFAYFYDDWVVGAEPHLLGWSIVSWGIGGFVASILLDIFLTWRDRRR